MRPLLIFLVTLIAGCDDAKERFRMIPTQPSPSHEDKVWVLDTKTGRVRLCYESGAIIKCLEPSTKFPE
jgi:hypothetical protein